MILGIVDWKRDRDLAEKVRLLKVSAFYKKLNKTTPEGSARQRTKALGQWGSWKDPVVSGEFDRPLIIFICKQSKWDNESFHLRQTRGGVVHEDECDVLSLQNCLRKLRLQLRDFLGSDHVVDARHERIWLLAIGAAKPLKQAVRALPGHDAPSWRQTTRDRTLAVAKVRALTPPEAAAKIWPLRPDTGAYSWSANAMNVSDGKPGLKARTRFGNGRDWGSGSDTRLHPPVVTSSDFVVFPRKRPGPRADGLTAALSKLHFYELPVVCVHGDPLYKLATAAMRNAWSAAQECQRSPWLVHLGYV